MNYIERLYEQAKDKGGKIILPEATLSERVMKAILKLVKDELADVVVIGEEQQFPIELRNSKHVTILNPNKILSDGRLARALYEKRKHKGLTYDEAQELIRDPIYLSTMIVEKGMADGMVVGAHYTTADSLRPALQIIKGKEGRPVIGSMIVDRGDFKEPKLFLDVSLNVSPSVEELARFGLEGAKFYENMFRRRARVVFLSYSTYGSGTGESVERMREASRLAKKKKGNKKYVIDGEIQFDAAVNRDVHEKKNPTSPIDGDANVFVFPDLNSANIGYKIAQRLGDCECVGPIMLNFRHPVNDLSRGCSVEDIYNTVIITKLQI